MERARFEAWILYRDFYRHILVDERLGVWLGGEDAHTVALTNVDIVLSDFMYVQKFLDVGCNLLTTTRIEHINIERYLVATLFTAFEQLSIHLFHQ